MHSITISPLFKEKCPQTRLGCLQAKVQYKKKPAALIQAIQETCQQIQAQQQAADIKKRPTIAAARQTYKTLGKDPSRYRLSAEALLRRVIKGKGLYQICNIVDALNLISIQTGFSIGGYDAQKIEGAIELVIGPPDTPYEAIGRGQLNIENLPVLHDAQGLFGSPTSDSTRTMVSPQTETFLMVFFDFGGDDSLENTLEQTIDLFQKYCDLKQAESAIIR